MLFGNFNGIFMSLFTLIAIGLGFVWVIKLEYYIGAQVAKWVAILGGLLIVGSLFIPNFTLSAMVGIVGGTMVWGATEFSAQEERVKQGIFPANPRKSDKNV